MQLQKYKFGKNLQGNYKNHENYKKSPRQRPGGKRGPWCLTKMTKNHENYEFDENYKKFLRQKPWAKMGPMLSSENYENHENYESVVVWTPSDPKTWIPCRMY